MSDLGAWFLTLTVFVAIGVVILAFIGGAIGLGVVLSIVLRRRGMVLPSAIVVTTLLVAVDSVSYVLYDIGGDSYARYSFWISVAWGTLGLTWLSGLGFAIGDAASHRQTIGRRAFWPLVVYAVGAFLFWGLRTLPDGLSTHSDAAMIEHFHRREAEFDRLAAMFEQDALVFQVCSPVREQRDVSPERLAEYGTLLEVVRVRHGITREPRGATLFRYWSMPEGGFAGQNLEKGYAFLDGPPTRLVGSLDGSRWNGEGLVYRHIGGRWHLYYFNRDSLRASCDLSHSHRVDDVVLTASAFHAPGPAPTRQ